MKITATVTDLDEFARYLANDKFGSDDDYETDEIIARLTQPFEATPEMRAGTALHKWLEHCHAGDEQDELYIDGFKFVFNCDIALPITKIREMRMTKWYGDLLVRGRVDSIDGSVVEDHKTTGAFSAEKFLNGYQWRYYLSMSGCDRFRWNVFIGSLNTVKGEKGDTFTVRSFAPLEALRYEDMEHDCEELAARFYEFAKQHLPNREIK